MHRIFVTGFLFVLALTPIFVLAASAGDVVFNEIAWMGTKANSADEWIELTNATGATIDLSGWGVYEQGGAVLIIELSGSITSGGYFLIERTDDTTVADVAADVTGPFGGSGLNNSGEHLVLKDNAGNVIDAVDAASGWPAGVASPDYATMERDANGWHTNGGATRNGTDAEGNPINGTPRAQNSVPAPPAPPPPQESEPVPAPPPASPPPAETPPQTSPPPAPPQEQATQTPPPAPAPEPPPAAPPAPEPTPAPPPAAESAAASSPPQAKLKAEKEVAAQAPQPRVLAAENGAKESAAIIPAEPVPPGDAQEEIVEQPALAKNAFPWSIYLLTLGVVAAVCAGLRYLGSRAGGAPKQE